VLTTFIFHYHVMHDNASIHDVSHNHSVPKLGRIGNNPKSSLEHPKALLYVFSCGLLHLAVVGPFLILCRMNRLHETTPLRINSIRQ
jgi:hypothetical protein